MKNWVAALLAAIFASFALPASAATITQSIVFSATNFFAYGAYPVPVDPVTGSITVTYDPSIEVQFVTAGVTLNGINIPHDTSYPLMLFNSPAAGQIGFGLTGGPVIPGYFSLALRPGLGTGTFLYSTLFDPMYLPFDPAGYGQFYSSNVTYAISQTPIPAALPLFASALGGIGLIGWKRRKQHAA